MEILYEMPCVSPHLALRPSTLPDISTVCGRKQELKMGIWRTFLGLTIDLHELGDIQAIDVTGVDCIAASKHYAKRTNYTFQAVETTLLVDCQTGEDPRYSLIDKTTTRFTGRLASAQTECRYGVNNYRRQGLRLVVTSQQTTRRGRHTGYEAS